MISLEQWKKMAPIGNHAGTAKEFSSLLDTICDTYDAELAALHAQIDRIDTTEDGTPLDPMDKERLNQLLDEEDDLHEMMDTWEEFTFPAYVRFIDSLRTAVTQ